VRKPQAAAVPRAVRCRRKFLRFFPGGFRDDTYLSWERGYKVAAHERWTASLHRAAFRALLDRHDYSEIARPGSSNGVPWWPGCRDVRRAF
jgi:hypothetical protein